MLEDTIQEAAEGAVTLFTPQSVAAWVREGSPQWQAIARSFERSRKRMPAPMTCKAEPGLGWWFDAELLKEHAA